VSEARGPVVTTKTKIAYVVDSPAGSGAMVDARLGIENEMRSRGLKTDYDNSYFTEARDDEIHVWFECEEPVHPIEFPQGGTGFINLEVAIPAVGFKGEGETDAERYRAIARRIHDKADIGGSNTRDALFRLLVNVAAALDRNTERQDAENQARAAERARRQATQLNPHTIVNLPEPDDTNVPPITKADIDGR